MYRNSYLYGSLVSTLAGLAGCSGGPAAKGTRKAAAAPDKIQGMVQQMTSERSATDEALNAGGPYIFWTACVDIACSSERPMR